MAGRQHYFLGIDGGGSTTRAAILDSSGILLGSGTAGPSNYQSAGISSTRENIRRATDAAFASAGLPPSPASAVFLGMAGVVSDTDRATIETIARELDLAERIGVDHDIRAALAGGLGGREGMALIAGTGSACYGRRNDGETHRAGGWGHLLDDPGSGYWIGLHGLMATVRGADGRAARTPLSDILMSALGLHDIDDMLRLAGHEGLSRTEVALLAPLVLEAWSTGDPAAGAILRQGADELAAMVRAVATRLGWDREPVSLVTIGGLFDNTGYRDLVISATGALLPAIMVTDPMLPPSIGAGLLAMELAGVVPDMEILHRNNQVKKNPAQKKRTDIINLNLPS